MIIVAPESPAAAEVRALLDEHLADMYATSPAESVHALDLTALLAPTVTFLTARGDDGRLLGCGALSELPPSTGDAAGTVRAGEVKSMRTARPARGRGVAAAVLDRLVGLARERGYASVSLETGPQEFFAPARRLYARHGFVPCGPFGDYAADPCSVFRTLDLTHAGVGPAA
ncbi:GNAT family N-acetyltransferase [Krasilnikoviella flava]|uniref:Putative acetyltransferase n=1 Tax=Krasilnikoviella flava TaxID=526729 RepID=A0A1T5L519_9MICO|nr:GNAT family N-acetyltransferase [Krasilnikoviella flava]SKC71166.1 putative acetyltransferase [Krasilnikoviella flava]